MKAGDARDERGLDEPAAQQTEVLKILDPESAGRLLNGPSPP
jgi:hypothetical protein